MDPIDIKPLSLPLPGGSEGASVTVRPLLTAELAVPPGFFDAPTGRLGQLGLWLKMIRGAKPDWPNCPVPAYLVTHPTAGHFLIDTGLHRSCAQPGGGNLGKVGRFYRIEMNPGQSAAERLDSRGISPDSLNLVVMTHLHNDHASGCQDFANATFVCDALEWEAAHAKRSWLNGYETNQFDLAVDWRSVDYFSDDAEHFAGFSRTVDLFGDGSVRLISTPGHSAGHQSVLLRLDHGELLVVADAAATEATLEGDARPLLFDDRHRFERSLKELRGYRALTPNALLVPGHDGDAWAKLDAVYGSEQA
ncbi:MAG: N-acyl homoserine lactonase family protein [Actinomycetes bacterium]